MTAQRNVMDAVDAVSAVTDSDLVDAARRGDGRAFDALVARYQHRVYGMALRLVSNPEDALEVAQDAFVRAHGALAGFRGEAAFASWLYRIVMNLARNRLRDRQRRGRNLAVSLDALREANPGREVAAPVAWNPRSAAEQVELQTLLQDALDALDAPYREAFVLRVYEDLSYEAIAEVMECPIGTVRSRIYSARRKLHAWLLERGAL